MNGVLSFDSPLDYGGEKASVCNGFNYINHNNDHIELLRSVCTPAGASEPEFSREEMEHLWSVLATMDDSKLPWYIPGGSEYLRQYHYLAEKYATMCRVHAKKPIKHRFAYLLKILKADAGIA